MTKHTKGYFLSNDLYDIAKHVTQIYLPAFGTLYFTLAGIWGLPNADAVVGTVVAVDTFLGVLLGISSKSFNDNMPTGGTIDVVEKANKTTYNLLLDGDPEDLGKVDKVVFKVNKPS